MGHLWEPQDCDEMPEPSLPRLGHEDPEVEGLATHLSRGRGPSAGEPTPACAQASAGWLGRLQGFALI